MLLLVALSAVIIPLILLVGFRMSARVGMTIVALTVALLASTVWAMSGLAISASALQGVHRALSIIWILFGAVSFLYTMQKAGAVERIKQGLHSISPDMRIQAVLVGFAFVSLIEGVSGFGTPSAIAVPLLLVLGFRPITSVVLAVVGDSVAVSFGAVATPLLIGLENVSPVDLNAVASKIVLIDAPIAILLPLCLVSILVVWFGRKSHRLKDILETAPWAMSVGLVYAVSAMLAVRFVGIEFASVLSGAVALSYGALTAHHNVITPKNIWRYHASKSERKVIKHQPTMRLWVAWLPYVAVVSLLLAQRTISSIKDFSLSVLDISWQHILGFEQITSTWQLLYSPGTTLLLVAIAVAISFRIGVRQLGTSLQQSLATVSMAAMALIPTLIMVQIFTNSGLTDSDYGSMPNYIGHALADSLGAIWPAVAPMLGALASFITGSSTVSTLTMSPVQYSVASQVGIPIDIAMAQQVSGANAGNIIAVHNVVAASTVAGLHHQEGRAMRYALPLVIFYLALSAITTTVILAIN